MIQRALNSPRMPYKPRRIKVQAFGFARASMKQMEMVVERVEFDFEAKAALAMRGR